MRVAFIIYDEMTALDFVGAYDPVTRLKTMGFIPELHWDICAVSREITASSGLRFLATKVGGSLEGYEMIIVPGGFGSRTLIGDIGFLDWLRSATDPAWKVSVCTGALLLGAAGFLEGKQATTHPMAFSELRKYCSSVVAFRVVEDGNVITAGGVTASIDVGLYLCEKLAGREARERIRQQLDYPYSPWNVDPSSAAYLI